MEINKKIKILDFKLSKILNWWLFWAYKSNFSGNWMEFSEHKEYHFWDHIKNIDWKASNKTDVMFVKKYEEERDLNVFFVLDNTISMNFWSHNITKKQLLEEVFYSLSLSAYHNNDNIWWMIFNENNINYIDYKKSKNNIYKILELLEKKEKFININGGQINKFNKIFKYIINRGIKDNLIFILTDYIDNIDETLLRLVANKNEIVYINIFDHFENNLINMPWNISLNLGNNFLNIDLSKKENIDKYRKQRREKNEYMELTLNKNKIWYIYLDTKSDIFNELIMYFNKIIK